MAVCPVDWTGLAVRLVFGSDLVSGVETGQPGQGEQHRQRGAIEIDAIGRDEALPGVVIIEEAKYQRIVVISLTTAGQDVDHRFADRRNPAQSITPGPM